MADDDKRRRPGKAVRNGYRMLAWLGVDDRPEPPQPADTLAAAKQQFAALQRWVRQKVKDGWTPPETSELEDDLNNSATPAKRHKRAELADQYEINFRIEKYLGQHPRATIREVAKVMGVSVGKVQQTEAWRREMATKPTPKIKERLQTKEMLAAIATNDAPTIKKVAVPARQTGRVVQAAGAGNWVDGRAP